MSRRSRKRRASESAGTAVVAADCPPPDTGRTTTACPPIRDDRAQTRASSTAQSSGRRDGPARALQKHGLQFQRGEIVWARVSVDVVVGQIAEAVGSMFLQNKADTFDAAASSDACSPAGDCEGDYIDGVEAVNTPVTSEHYALRPCIVSHQTGKTLFVLVLASFRGNPIESVSGLAQFFCVAMGEAARDEDVLTGRPFLESTPPWTHPDGRNCYALAFVVATKTYYVSRQRKFKLVEGFDTFNTWMKERMNDLVALPDDGGRALLASYLQNKNPLDTPPEYPSAVAWNDVAASAASWVLSSPLSWTSSAMSSSSYAPSLLSALGLNPHAAEFRPSSIAGTSVTHASHQALSHRPRNVLRDPAGALRTDAAYKSSSEVGKENIPPN